MIKDRQVFQSVLIEYEGKPIVKVTVDGSDVLTASGKTLPEHTVRQTRRISLPQGAQGYVAQMSSNLTDITRYQFESQPESSFSENILFHYYEITFNKSLQVKLYMDEVSIKPNNSINKVVSLKPRAGRIQDTIKVYFPPLSYGYIPHIEQVISSAQKGQILSSKPVALPIKYYKGLKTHTEYQVTYQGNVELALFMDGEQLSKEWLPEILIPQDGGYKTHKDYFPSNSSGQVLQWVQTDGDGDIALFETDQTLLDTEQPQQQTPQGQ
tara:strand:- start:106 stop:909 length:804 start_codon:yes stop_codon:yes gene_type:complete